MGVELFGGENVLYYAVACYSAYYCSGHTGIYHAQRVAVAKTEDYESYTEQSLNDIRERKKNGQ
jgi:hypothetical protein